MNDITKLLKRLATSERVWSMLAAGVGAGVWAVHVIQWARKR